MVYVFLVMIPFLIYFALGYRKKMIMSLFGSVILFAAWTGPIASLFPINDKMEQSALLVASVPTNQLSRVWNDAGVSSEDKSEIEQILDEQYGYTIANYQELSSDASRLAFYKILVADPEHSAFFETYISMGLRYPRIYADAALALTYEAWYPFSTVEGYNNGWNTWYRYDESSTSLFACVVESPGELNSKIPWLYDILWNISRFNTMQSNPLTAWMVSIPFCMWVFLLAVARAVILRQKEILIPSLLLLLTVGTLLLGPMVLVRYYLFLFYLLPVFFFFLFGSTQSIKVA